MNICHLCGADFKNECVELFGQLTFYALQHTDPAYFIHQHVVDAYGAQHITKESKRVAVGATLLGLYLFSEHGYTGKQVQNTHMALGKKMEEIVIKKLPTKKAPINVSHVLGAKEGPERDQMVKDWVKAVWEIWKHEQPAIEEVLKKYPL